MGTARRCWRRTSFLVKTVYRVFLLFWLACFNGGDGDDGSGDDSNGDDGDDGDDDSDGFSIGYLEIQFSPNFWRQDLVNDSGHQGYGDHL